MHHLDALTSRSKFIFDMKRYKYLSLNIEMNKGLESTEQSVLICKTIIVFNASFMSCMEKQIIMFMLNFSKY